MTFRMQQITASRVTFRTDRIHSSSQQPLPRDLVVVLVLVVSLLVMLVVLALTKDGIGVSHHKRISVVRSISNCCSAAAISSDDVNPDTPVEAFMSVVVVVVDDDDDDDDDDKNGGGGGCNVGVCCDDGDGDGGGDVFMVLIVVLDLFVLVSAWA